ncbi:MAG: hypothetical protein ACPGJU_10035, partial [Coraliomargarita sp.]
RTVGQRKPPVTSFAHRSIAQQDAPTDHSPLFAHPSSMAVLRIQQQRIYQVMRAALKVNDEGFPGIARVPYPSRIPGFHKTVAWSDYKSLYRQRPAGEHQQHTTNQITHFSISYIFYCLAI